VTVALSSTSASHVTLEGRVRFNFEPPGCRPVSPLRSRTGWMDGGWYSRVPASTSDSVTGTLTWPSC